MNIYMMTIAPGVHIPARIRNYTTVNIVNTLKSARRQGREDLMEKAIYKISKFASQLAFFMSSKIIRLDIQYNEDEEKYYGYIWLKDRTGKFDRWEISPDGYAKNTTITIV